MISLKRFLAQDDGIERAGMHVVRTLVDGIGRYAIEGDPAGCERFREKVREVSASLTDEIAPADLLVHTGAVLQALEEHNRGATHHLRLQAIELQNMLKMLTSTVGVVSAVSDGSISRLAEIEKQLAVATQIDDVRVIRSRLSECLADIRREAERERKATGEVIEQLTLGLEQSRKRSSGLLAGSNQDAVTGLPARPEAEALLAEWGRVGNSSYAALLVLDRLQTINVRFGREVGDEVLAEFAGVVRKRLTSSDRLFRWSGTALLALLPRENGLELVRGEIGRIMETRLEHTVQTPSRSILLPVTARWAVFPMMVAPRLLYQKLDVFAAAPGSRD